jgi:steroid delta-isomerase
MRAGRLRPTVSAIGAALLLGSAAAAADGELAAETAIRAALAKWVVDFNAGHSRAVCDIFAPDLRYDYRDYPERDYRSVCDLLQRVLANPQRSFRYAVELQHVLVSDDLAAVRVVWTLTGSGVGLDGVVTAEEPGLDIFRRQADGVWRIVRYVPDERPPPPKPQPKPATRK